MAAAEINGSLAFRLTGTGTAQGALSATLLALAGTLLLALAAKTQVPFWPVPMTLQTLALFLIASAYGMRLGVATVFLYLAEGLAGLPVFAGPAAGPAYFAGPTAGFLAGFVVAAAIVGYAADRGWSRNPFKMFGAMILAGAALFLSGFVWLGFIFVSAKTGTALGAEFAWSKGVLPFILADLLKIAIASCLVAALWRLPAWKSR